MTNCHAPRGTHQPQLLSAHPQHGVRARSSSSVHPMQCRKYRMTACRGRNQVGTTANRKKKHGGCPYLLLRALATAHTTLTAMRPPLVQFFVLELLRATQSHCSHHQQASWPAASCLDAIDLRCCLQPPCKLRRTVTRHITYTVVRHCCSSFKMQHPGKKTKKQV